jgi:ribosomal protein S12 methylthiotransferase accessory factor
LNGAGASGLAPAPHLDVAIHAERGASARSAAGVDVFHGAEYASALRLADGTRDASALAAAVAERGASAEEAERVVTDLLSAGVLVPRDETLAGAAAAYWTAAGVAPRLAAERLARTRVSVTSDGVDAGDLPQALVEAGVTLDADGDLQVVLAVDYLDDSLRARNEEALDSGLPWMLASLGAQGWIGPVVVPDRGPCWECLAHRIRRHRASAQLDTRAEAHPLAHGQAAPPTGRRVAEAAVATELARWIVLGPASGASEHVRTIEPPRWATRDHLVVRRPQCPACGIDGAEPGSEAHPIDLGERVPAVAGLRAASAATTFERLSHHVSPVSGLVAGLAPARGARPPRHAYAAGAIGTRTHGRAVQNAPNMAGGKGVDELEARTGALCEALERYSGEFSGDEPRRRAALDEIRADAIHPNDCMLFSARQYERRDELNALSHSFRTHVPEPFDEQAPVDWTPLWSLTAARERLLPSAYCLYGAPGPGRASCVPDSNGNAAGTTIEEAVLHGLLELVERDHVALWWYNRLPRPGLDLASFRDPWLESLRATLADEGRDLWALDLTMDLGIPVVAALATRADGDGVVLGLGAHVEMAGALVRAAAELVQLDLGAPAAGLGAGPAEAVHAAGGAYLRPDPGMAPRVAEEAERPRQRDLRAELDRCIAAVEAQGLEMLVLDQTRPDVGLPVVKVVVPGLRHFWPRFGPGRLYDVPVSLGRLDGPLPEVELNPYPPVP